MRAARAGAACGPCAAELKALEKWIDGYRYVPWNRTAGTSVRDIVFREANAEYVLCVDSHVLIVPGALRKLLDYLLDNPETRDLLQGPLLYDDLRTVSTHMEPRWSCGMYGVWGTDERAADLNAPPFEIVMQGLGVFGCRRSAWPGFNPRLRGFGARKATFRRSSDAPAAARFACHFSDGCIGSAAPWGRRMRMAGRIASGIT